MPPSGLYDNNAHPLYCLQYPFVENSFFFKCFLKSEGLLFLNNTLILKIFQIESCSQSYSFYYEEFCDLLRNQFFGLVKNDVFTDRGKNLIFKFQDLKLGDFSYQMIFLSVYLFFLILWTSLKDYLSFE